MKFQSKFRNHMIPVRSTIFEPIGMGRVRPVPGLVAKFRGPQRLFDLDATARELNWSDEEKEAVLDHLLNHKKFMIDFFPAPFEQVPEDKQHLVQRKPAAQVRFCLAMAYVEEDGVTNIAQCRNQATAGRDYCADHDPEVPKIVKGVVGGA